MSKAKSSKQPKFSRSKNDTSKQAVDKKDPQAQAVETLEKVYVFINRYILLFVILLSSGTIIGAILFTQRFLDPKRDETAYLEQSSSIIYQEIDKEKLKTLEESLDNSSVDVPTDYTPGRSNPFVE